MCVCVCVSEREGGRKGREEGREESWEKVNLLVEQTAVKDGGDVVTVEGQDCVEVSRLVDLTLELQPHTVEDLDRTKYNSVSVRCLLHATCILAYPGH